MQNKNMQTEILGTANLERLLARSGRLSPNVQKNDRGLSWDGYVVYRSDRKNQPKDNLLLQVPIQVKGHVETKPGESADRFAMELSDLRNYQARGGTLFFKISVDNAGENERFFYKALLPGDVSRLLQEARGQQTKTVRLDPFPTDIGAVEAILTAFARAMKRQTEDSTLCWADFAPAAAEGRGSDAVPAAPARPKDPYLYNSELLPFQLREAEQKELRAFVADGRPFCWWAIVGPGGAGKTRLAYEFQKELEAQGRWTVEKLSSSKMHDLPRLSRDELLRRYPGPTLLILDYAQQFASRLGEWMDRLTAEDWEWDPEAPLRLLLLERADKDAEGEYPWEKELLQRADSYRLRQARFTEVLELRAEQELLFKIMERFAAYLRQKEAELPALTEEEIRSLSEQFRGREEGSRTPLFAMLLIDAKLHNELQPDWSWETLLAFRAEREARILKNRLRELAGGDRLLRKAVFALRRAATALGTAGDPEWRALGALLPECAETVRRAAAEAKQPEEELLQSLDLMDGSGRRIHALRPDLLGEYAVLDWLRREEPDQRAREDFFGAVLSDPDAASTFFLRLLRDFPELLTSPEGGFRDWLIPAGMELTEWQTAALVELLDTLFKGAPLEADALSPGRPGGYVFAGAAGSRRWLLQRMEEYGAALREESADTASAYTRLASVYRAMGDYPKALEFHEKARKIAERVLGPEHPDTAATYNNLASVYQEMRDYPKALEFHQRALAIREKLLGPEHPDTAASCNNLANVYRAMGNYPKALEFHQRALAIREKLLGPEHPDTAASCNNLANVYYSMGNYPKALEFYQRALAIREKVLGEEHPDTAASCNNLANVYYSMGNYPKALEFYQRALAIREKVLGEEHPDTATTYNNLANVYRAMGNYPKALEFHEKAQKILERVLGEEHPDTATTYNNMALVYQEMGDYPKALEFCQRALAIREKLLGPEHPDTATTYHNLAVLYLRDHNLKEALRCSNRALIGLERVLGADHPNTRKAAELNGLLKTLSSLQERLGDELWQLFPDSR